MANFIIPTVIYLIVPASGFFGYLQLRKRMLAAATPNPPVVAFFVLFLSYGGWLLLLLTALFWYHSSLATIGLAFVMFVAPVMMLLFAIQLYKHRYLSPFHMGAFVACAVYLLFPFVLLLL